MFLKDFKVVTKIILFSLVGAIILGYALLTSRNLIAGPTIEIYQPQNGENLEESLVTIKGKAQNIMSISLNDGSITIDEEGLFEEKMILAQGYNIIKFKANDRFGRERLYFLELTHSI